MFKPTLNLNKQELIFENSCISNFLINYFNSLYLFFYCIGFCSTTSSFIILEYSVFHVLLSIYSLTTFSINSIFRFFQNEKIF